MTGIDEKTSIVTKPPHSKIGLIAAIASTVAGAAGMLYGCLSIRSLFLSFIPRSAFDEVLRNIVFERYLALVFHLPALLSIVLCATILLFGGISALLRFRRAFVWSITGCALLVVAYILVFARGLSLFHDPMRHVSDLWLDFTVFAVAVVLLVLNFLAHRKSTSVKIGLAGKIALGILIAMQLFLFFGWHRIGTFLALKDFRESFKGDIAVFDARVADGVVEYKQDWGDAELEHHQVGIYTITVPKGYFDSVKVTSSEDDPIPYQDEPLTYFVFMESNELNIFLMNVPGENEPEDYSAFGSGLSDLPVDVFDGITDSFERHKMVLNTVTDDFSFLMTHNDCLRLLFRIYAKHYTITTTYDSSCREIRTKFLRGLQYKMISPFYVDFYDREGREMILSAGSQNSVDGEELPPEHQRLVKNIIASIRPAEN